MVCMWFVCGNFDVNLLWFVCGLYVGILTSTSTPATCRNQKDPLTALQMDVVTSTAFAQTCDYVLVGILVF